MKKIVIFAFVVAMGVGIVFAQGSFSQPSLSAIDDEVASDTSTQLIKVEDKYPELHPKAQKVELELEYIPLTGEVHFYYTCNQAAFDEGEAMNTAMAVYDDFAAEHKFKHKRYLQKDKTRFFKDENRIKKAQYISHVLFTK